VVLVVPLALADPVVLVEAIGPTLTRYLRGPIGA